ncbi:MAG: host attachment protein [Rhodospirillales bacterium]|nr:host attachment protein [Rhodospirillales bacterium]
MRHPERLLIVLADGEHARLVRPGAVSGFATLATLAAGMAGQRTSDMVSDRQGRAFESASPTRHAFTPRHDPKREAHVAFAHEVAARIGEESFDALVLVAPPRTLAPLTEALPAPARERLRGSVAKDLTKVADAELGAHLHGFLGLA